MKQLLIFAAMSPLLAGCVGNDRLADAHVCETVMPANTGVASQFFPQSGLSVPARSLLGGGKVDPDDAISYICVDGTDSNAKVQVPNLHKVRLDHLSSAS